MNPAGQVPVVELGDGRVLSQSNAILQFLAEGTALLPKDWTCCGIVRLL
jgi:glutathione S-transferase